MGQVQTRAYRDGKIDDEGFDLADVSEHLSRKGTVVWIDQSSCAQSSVRCC